MARRRRSDDDDDEAPVPRIPRGKGLALSTGQIVRIVMVAAALLALIALQKPCSKSVGRFVTSFDGTDAAIQYIDAAPGAPPPQGVILRGDMTPAELEAAIAKGRAAEAAAGISDAGSGDAGTSDGGTSDAGTRD